MIECYKIMFMQFIVNSSQSQHSNFTLGHLPFANYQTWYTRIKMSLKSLLNLISFKKKKKRHAKNENVHDK